MESASFTRGNIAQKWGLTVLVAIAILTGIDTVASPRIFLGPANSNGGSDWLTGANGGGTTTLDSDDPPTGGFDFTISNTVAGKESNGDWRCPPFSLGPAAGGSRPIAFSFAYKLLDPVAKGNNIHVQLRFFDATGTHFISEIVLPIGAHTGDSQMTDYKTRTIDNIPVPRQAKTADIWIDANIFEPWVSGTARFGNFSVSTMPRSLIFVTSVTLGALFGLGVLIWLAVYFWQRSRHS